MRWTGSTSRGIRRAHLLLAMFNAWQPGVFALSGWDLLGILPVPADAVRDLVSTGDTRRVHRGAHDLMAAAPEATASSAGMPLGRSLYGSLPDPAGVRRVLRRRTAVGPRHPAPPRHRGDAAG
jgi:hypothetical protein